MEEEGEVGEAGEELAMGISVGLSIGGSEGLTVGVGVGLTVGVGVGLTVGVGVGLTVGVGVGLTVACAVCCPLTHVDIDKDTNVTSSKDSTTACFEKIVAPPVQRQSLISKGT
ncbi:MAG: hypothetical protein ACXV6L_07410 [Halobacteriota archaeon]